MFLYLLHRCILCQSKTVTFGATQSTPLCLFKDKNVEAPTWCFEGSRGTLGPGWCDAHLGRHAPPPRACLGHLGQRSGLLTGILVLALGLRRRGG